MDECLHGNLDDVLNGNLEKLIGLDGIWWKSVMETLV